MRAQRLSASNLETQVEVVAHAGDQLVLNAYRHLILKHICHTRQTILKKLTAQRLSASNLETPITKWTFTAEIRNCSTPIGI